MGKKLFRIIKVLLLLVIIVTVGYGIYGQICLTDERSEDMSFCKPLDTRWYRVWEDGHREEIKLPSSEKIENEKTDVVETVLYDEITRGACISIISSKQDVNVYIDGELRESYSTKDTRLYGKTSVGRFIFVELDKEDAGKVLRIEMSSESKYLGTVKQVYYGDKLGIWLNYIKSNVASIIIPFMSLIIAFVTVVFSFIYYLRAKKTVSVFYYAVAVMLISMWILSISSIRQLLFRNITVIHDISIVLVTLFLVPLSIYFNKLQNGRYKLMYGVYALIVLLYTIGVNIFVALDLLETSNTALFNFIIIGICMVMFIVTLCMDIKNKKINEYKDVALGFLVVCFAGAIQMSVYFVRTVPYEGNAIAIGILVSLIISIYHSIKEVKKVNDEKEYLEEKVTVNELKIEKLTYQALETLANTIDAKDKYTNGHSNRVAKYSKEIATRMGKDGDEAIAIYFMGLLHDIGKIGIRDDIINKANRLTDEEFMVIKNHPVIGHDILKNMTEIPNIEYGARWHHEKYDGSGYPDGLKGEEIPEYARIICVADAYDAMTSARTYRGPMCPFKVVEIFEREGLQKYDTKYIMTFLENIINTYLSHEVRLSDGRIGTVIFVNNRALSRPLIQCGDTYVDLTKEPTSLTIEEIL